VINTHWPLTLSANAVLERERLPKGRTGLVSQSGSMIGALVSRGEARGIGFSTLVSIGNECDLTVGEIASMLVDDPETDVILLFLETMRDPAGVAAMAARAHAKGKPIMAYVLGRSDLGQALAQSHTGAMVGETRALDAFLADCGIMRLDNFESLIEAPLLLRGRKPPKGKRVAVTTTTGGAAALVVDHLGSRKIDVAPGSPIADVTMAGTKPEVVDTVMSNFMADPRVDAVVVGVGSSAEYFPELAVAPLAKWATAEKPIVAFLLPNAQRSLELLASAGIAGFRTPEACADALGAYLDWTLPREKSTTPLPKAARTCLDRAKGAATLNEQRALELFSALGVPVPVIAHVSDAAGVDALKINYPVVAKILSADIAHKSEVGGVKVGIADAAALKSTVASLLTDVPKKVPGARIDGVVVQEMIKGGLGEAIVGFRRDPRVGPLVAVGVGGILAEVYGDVAVRPAPVDLQAARAMIAEVKGFAPLRGFRSLPEGDLEALAAIVVGVSQLALSDAPRIAEAEINPVIVRAKRQGAVAVDGLAVLLAD
jgi:acyl-CoA synthetase (NDP forming)